MPKLKNVVEEKTPDTIVNNNTYTEPFFGNVLDFPLIDRRATERRTFGRRVSDNIGLITGKMKKITILIPCFNEEKGISKVIDDVPYSKLAHLGYKAEILVIDNNSSDKTMKIARAKGARIVSEKKQGKGNALKTGFKNISEDTDYVVMLDGDNTYKAQEIIRMIEPLENDFCDIVVGSRLEGKFNGHSLSFSHRIANWIFTFMVRRFYLVNTTDTCTGYFAWKKKVVDRLMPYIKSNGFAIEAEMITKMARLGYKIYSVPITYDKREGESKLSPYIDSIRIIWMLLKNISWKPRENAF